MAKQKSKRSRPSAKSRAERRVLPHNSPTPVRKFSAKIKKAKKPSNSPLTQVGKKRGRKFQVRVSEICNRAYDLKMILDVNRKKFDWEQLLAAKSDQDLELALSGTFDRAKENLLCKPGLLLSVLRDRQFPKQVRGAQEQFIADSLAAEGRVSIRRSRDIAQRDRSARKKQGKILRREFYIECSCGYEGPAHQDSCPDCGAAVSYLDFATGFAFQNP